MPDLGDCRGRASGAVHARTTKPRPHQQSRYRDNRKYLLSLNFSMHYIRDVGVAGSNPVTTTNDSRVFSPSPALGSVDAPSDGVLLGVPEDRQGDDASSPCLVCCP